MKSIVCQKPGELHMQQVSKPIPKAGEVVVKIKCIGVCGTDIHAYGGNQPFFSYPRVLGHELSGEIDSVGEGVDLALGKAAYVIPYIHCGECIACNNGKTNCCTNIGVVGVHRDGGMCEYLCVPASHVIVSEDVSFEQLAIVECLAIGAHAVNRAAITKNDTVMVLGAGPIGLGAAQFSQVAGAKTFIADVSDERLAFCKKEFNFDAHIDCKNDVEEQLSTLTQGDFPTVIIDATGNPKAMESCFTWLGHGGKIVFISIVKADISFHDPEFHKRETTLLASRNATKEDFEHVITCIKNNSVKSSCMISHRTSFDEFTDKFPQWIKPDSGLIKAVIHLD